MRRIIAIIKNEQGATAVEYGLILAMIFLAMIAGVSSFADTTINMWSFVANEVSGR
jgi:pilus assembly protein Flp/PilA